MRTTIIVLLGMFIANLFQAQTTHTLTINISGIKKVKGKIGLCLLTDPEEFLSDCSDYSEMTVNKETLTMLKKELLPGSYAVTIYHDANSNGQLDTNFFGMPKERYGFSNNPRAAFGPPSFKKCLFEVRRDTVISIRLK